MRFYDTTMYCKTTGMWPSRPQQPDDGVGIHRLVNPDDSSREGRTEKKTEKERMKQAVKRTLREREESRIVIKIFTVSPLAAGLACRFSLWSRLLPGAGSEIITYL